MPKRTSPDSGFGTINSSKRQATNDAITSCSEDPVDSIKLNPSSPPVPSSAPSATPTEPIPRINGSTAQLPPTITKPHHALDEDAFMPDFQPANTTNHEDDFLPDDNQKKEMAKELASLQASRTSTFYDTADPSIITPDAEDSHHDNEDQSGDGGTEQGALEPSSGRQNNSKRNKFKKNKIWRMFRQPILWHDGAPDHEAAFAARKSDALICGTTNLILDTEPLLVNGTLWKEILLDELPDLLRSEHTIPLPSAQDEHDFLKACFRLGRCMEPYRMSRLLGGGYRTPQYCAFLLQGFLGLLTNPKVQRVLQGSAQQPPVEEHRDVVVYGDQLYPSDDEIIVIQDTESANPEKGQAPQDGNTEVATIEESDREEDDGHNDPPDINRASVHEITHTDSAEERFLVQPSYVLRNYMSIVTGQEIKDIDDFEVYCKKVGATFCADYRKVPLNRLKWLKERMPAPELGTERSVLEPRELWKHAMKTYSVKNLTRCALIKVNPLLDWLGYVANESEPATSEEEYFRLKRPVVSIAPIPLLYLADKAVDFALRTLTVAVQTEEQNPVTEDEDATDFVIDIHDVRSAAQYLEENVNRRPLLYFCAGLGALGGQHSYNCEWPALVQRPLTASESLELCDRVPKATISIPNSITEEMRAVLMSFRQCVKRRLYANAKMLMNKDPLVYMPQAERIESRNKRIQRNIEYGINQSRKVPEGKNGEEDDDEDNDDVDLAAPGKQMGNQMFPAKKSSTGAEHGNGQFPSADQTLGCAVPANESTERAPKIPEFFDQVNFAELTAFRIGDDELKKRKRNETDFHSNENEYLDSNPDSTLCLKQSVNDKKITTSTVCFHRLGWICLHALGIAIDKSPDDTHTMGYGSSANYTNFAQLRTTKPVILTTGALHCLAQMADVLVREEAEVLMACAAHDDGRPWIDRADVALVTSIRKEQFHYLDL